MNVYFHLGTLGSYRLKNENERTDGYDMTAWYGNEPDKGDRVVRSYYSSNLHEIHYEKDWVRGRVHLRIKYDNRTTGVNPGHFVNTV